MRTAVERALEDIGGLDQLVSPGDRVVLKPNINGTECVTSVGVVETLLELLHDCSVTDMAIAEATFGGSGMTARCFAANGYGDLARRWDIDLINLNDSEPVKLPVANPLITDTISVAREIVEADRLINIPVMKVHYATGITLCLKNLKGVLVGDEKRRFHELGLDRAIADLNRTVSPDLNLVDAVECMERMGPRGGDMVTMNLVLAGRTSAYVDAVGARVMGFEAGEIGHLQQFCAVTGLNPGDAQPVGDAVESVQRRFVRADLSDSPAATASIRNIDACSSCMNALILSLMSSEGVDLSGYQFCLGSTFGDDRDDEAHRTVAFGKCAIAALDTADVVVPGCPPYPFELRGRLSDKRRDE